MIGSPNLVVMYEDVYRDAFPNRTTTPLPRRRRRTQRPRRPPTRQRRASRFGWKPSPLILFLLLASPSNAFALFLFLLGNPHPLVPFLLLLRLPIAYHFTVVPETRMNRCLREFGRRTALKAVAKGHCHCWAGTPTRPCACSSRLPQPTQYSAPFRSEPRRRGFPTTPSSTSSSSLWSSSSSAGGDSSNFNDSPKNITTTANSAKEKDDSMPLANHLCHNQESLAPEQPELSSLAKSVRDTIHDLLSDHLAAGDSPTTTTIATAEEASSFSSPEILLPVVVAVSGGCDSVALFHALAEWKNSGDDSTRLRLDATVVHFHHRQRPVEADRDCELVRGLVEQHNKQNPAHAEMAFVLQDWNDEDQAEAGFSQDQARNWRRRKLAHHARKRLRELREQGPTTHVPLAVVLTAHHAGDSYETVLLKLLRGVHLLNLHDRATIARVAELADGEPETNNDEALPVYLVRPFVGDALTRMHPGHTKDELIQYLTDRNLPWREDASNQSSKYLRNRVRNELVPLLADLTEDAFRTKRVPAMLEQSQDLYEDATPRVRDYAKRAVNDDGSFALAPSNPEDTVESKLVRDQALYEWMASTIRRNDTNQASFSSHAPVSYESLRRVVNQIEEYPHRREWTLELGGGAGWTVRRRGSVLQMRREDRNEPGIEPSTKSSWEWTVVTMPRQKAREEDEPTNDENVLTVRVPASWIGRPEGPPRVAFASVPLADASPDDAASAALRLVPPWRNSNSPVKLRALLRGRGVPLHERDAAPVVLATPWHDDDDDSTGGGETIDDAARGNGANAAVVVVAVWANDRWIVDKRFRTDPAEPEATTGTVVLRLSKENRSNRPPPISNPGSDEQQ